MNPEDVLINTRWANDISLTAKIGTAAYHYGILNGSEELSNMSRDGTFYSIIHKSNDRLIGNCNFFDLNHINRTSEISIIIGSKEDRGKGYGVEALILLISYGIKILNINNILARIYSFNKIALKTFKKAGFTVIGKRQECYYLNGKYHDEIYMELLSRDFKSAVLNEQLNFIV